MLVILQNSTVDNWKLYNRDINYTISKIHDACRFEVLFADRDNEKRAVFPEYSTVIHDSYDHTGINGEVILL